jgi:FMN phosphatase YigB (HAD superfamily)
MAEWPRVEAMPGAREAVAGVSPLIVQCVASNATESDGPAVARALARVGLREHLTHFVTSSEVGVSKPDPAFFMEVSRRMGLSPEALVAVGNDYRKDIAPAKAVGMATVLVSADADPEAHPDADLILPDLMALVGLL